MKCGETKIQWIWCESGMYESYSYYTDINLWCLKNKNRRTEQQFSDIERREITLVIKIILMIETCVGNCDNIC